MTSREYRQHLAAQVRAKRISTQEMGDLLKQRAFFDHARARIERRYRGRLVGFIAGQMMVSTDVHDLLAKADVAFPDKLLYFEPIGFKLI